MAGSSLMDDTSHRRFNPLTGRWVLVSPGRDRRPWQGGREAPAVPPVAAHDPDCGLCPGNARAGGGRNPSYQGPYVFPNDFPALRPAPAGGAGLERPGGSELLRGEPAYGTCRVLCFGPRHDRGLVDLTAAEVRAVVDAWARQEAELSRDWRWVQIFENRGAAMGASNPHPHGQIWATGTLPDEPAAEDARQTEYHTRLGSSLLLDYAETELAEDERLVLVGDAWLVLVPFWAVWPFETLLLPRRPVDRLAALTAAERDALAEALRRLLAGYDALFDHPFPYSMGWHGAPGPHPADPRPADAHAGPSAWQLHAHFYPPLLRSPTVRKHLVGYEMLAEVQRDITPETAAARLRAAMDRAPGGRAAR